MTFHRTALRAPTDDPNGPLRFVIATEGRKADGIDLRMDNVDLGRYTGNPVVMAMHDYRTLPVGRGENIAVDGKSLLADAVFDLDDPVGAALDRKYRAGFMNAVSVGFDAYDIDEQGVPARWELLEFSAVPIPMDAGALLDSGRQARAVADLLTEIRGEALNAEQLALLGQLFAAPRETPEPDSGQDTSYELARALDRLRVVEATASL